MTFKSYIIAIDPGTNESAFVIFDSSRMALVEFAKIPNEELLARLYQWRESEYELVIEMLRSYGNVMGDDILKTCVWIGRYLEAWKRDARLIPRKEVVLALCQNVTSGDKEVRRAVIDAFGGDASIGTKKSPGPLYGVARDVWSALALALAHDQSKRVDLIRLLA